MSEGFSEDGPLKLESENELTEGWSCWKNPGKENKICKGTVKEITWCD